MEDVGTDSVSIGTSTVTWILGAIGAVMATLWGALVSLSRAQSADSKKRIEELEARSQKCEEDRLDLYGKCQMFEGRIAGLEAKLDSK